MGWKDLLPFGSSRRDLHVAPPSIGWGLEINCEVYRGTFKDSENRIREVARNSMLITHMTKALPISQGSEVLIHLADGQGKPWVIFYFCRYEVKKPAVTSNSVFPYIFEAESPQALCALVNRETRGSLIVNVQIYYEVDGQSKNRWKAVIDLPFDLTSQRVLG